MTPITPAASTEITPRSTRSPSLPSSAGSTVSDPIIATATTIIAPTPSDVNVFEPVSSMPAIAISTVAGDQHRVAGRCRGAADAVGLAVSGGALGPRPLDVEQAVV